MITLGSGINEFLEKPNNYVLRLKENSLIAEEKGFITWFKAHMPIISRQYNLPKIVQAIYKSWREIQPDIPIDSLAKLKEKLTLKTNDYNYKNLANGRPQITVDIRALFDTILHRVPPPELRAVPQVQEKTGGSPPVSPSPTGTEIVSTPSVEEEFLTPTVSEASPTPSVGEEATTPPVTETGTSPPVPVTSPTPPVAEEAASPPIPELAESSLEHEEDLSGFHSIERLGQMLSGKLFDIFIPQNPEEEAVKNAIGMQLISEAGFKIGHAAGDGNCLFTSIAVGLLTRIPVTELAQRLHKAIEAASACIDAYGPPYDFHIDLRAESKELIDRLSTSDAPSEIAKILTNPQVRNTWAWIFRGLSLARQLEWHITDRRLLLYSMQDHDINLEEEELSEDEYLTQMMVTEEPIIWGSASDIIALQECLEVTIPWLSGQSSGEAGKVVITKIDRLTGNSQPIPTKELQPSDILVLYDAGLKHYDPAFYPPLH